MSFELKYRAISDEEVVGEPQIRLVPDDSWVIEVVALRPAKPDSADNKYLIVGREPTKVEWYLTEVSPDLNEYTLVSEDPFGIVQGQDYMPILSELPWMFEVAKQIKLGKAVAKPRLPNLGQKIGTSNEAWVPLRTLANKLGSDSRTLWQYYYDISANHNLRGEKICITIDCPTGKSLHSDKDLAQLSKYIAPNEHDRIWVPAHWATSVYYMHMLGLTPGCPLP